jgi:chromosome partitioning protein
MRVFVLTSQKGGVGKTSLSASLAVAAAEAGEKVVAFDLDPQGSLTAWGNMREAENPHIEAYPTSRAAELPEVIRSLRKSGFTAAFIDTPGTDNTATHAAMDAATLCLVPIRPTRLDANAVMPTVHALIRGHTPFAFILSQTPTQPRNTRAQEMAAGLGALGLLADPMIGQRADHQDAYAMGQGVTEYAPSGKAADEIRGLWRWIDSHSNSVQTKRGRK